MCKGNIIHPDDLPPFITSSSETDTIRLKAGVSLAEAERIIIESTLSHCNGNKSKTAEVLGIGRKTLHRKLDEYDDQLPVSK